MNLSNLFLCIKEKEIYADQSRYHYLKILSNPYEITEAMNFGGLKLFWGATQTVCSV